MTCIMRRSLVRSFLLLLSWWALAMPVSAHGYLVRSIPPDRSQLERSPTRLQYWFSEQLEPRFSRLTLRDSSGQIIAEGGVDESNRNLMALRLPPNALPDGVYIVELSPAFASDGHVSLSTNVFTVGAASGLVESQAASTLPLPLEVVWKVLLLSGTHLLFGTAMLYVYVLRPAWGSSRYPAGGLPPRVMNRLYALMGVGLALALVGNVLALLQQSAVFFNTSVNQVLESGLWQVVRIGSRFGDVWNVRMFFLIVMAGLVAASLYYRTRHPETVRAFWVAGTWCMALVLGANAIISHAAGSLVMPWVALSMHWLHTLASAFWVGGLAALALTLPAAIQPYEGEARRQVILTAMRRYSLLVVGALAVVVTSGLYNSSNWFYTPQDVTTVYGGTLALKVLLVAILIAAGGLHHLALRPALAERLKVERWPLVRQAGQFHSTLNAETVIAALVLVTAGALSSTPVPVPDFLDRRLPPNTQTLQVGEWLITATVAPGGTGINTVDVSVTEAGSAAARDDLRVTLQLSDPLRDVRGPIHSAEPLGEGLYTAFLDDIDTPGRWWSSIDLRTPDEERLRAALSGTSARRPT
jgi:copper transport protein